jgi:GGDEF domain-containing protein
VGSSQKQLSTHAAEQKGFLPAVQALLHGIAVNTVKGDPEEDRQFRTRMVRISEAVDGEPSWLDAKSVADSAIGALHDHNARASRYHHSNASELRAVIQVLIGTLEDLSIGSPRRMQELRELGKRLAAATGPEAIGEGKLKLSQCLAGIRQEAERHRQFSGGHSCQDPVTGLEGRPSAEAALTQACVSDTSSCAVIVLVDRLALYNRRYGRDVGDKVLRFFVEFVKGAFEPGLPLFRWTGPAVLLLRPGSHEGVQSQMRRAFDPRLEFEVDSGSRSILLSVGISWSVLPMMVDPRLVVNKIDAFVSD